MGMLTDEERAQRLLVAAQAQFTEVRLTADGIASFCARVHALALEDMADPRVSEIFLVVAAGYGDAAAIGLIDHELKLLLPAAKQAGLSDDDLDDLAQILRIRFFSPSPSSQGILGYAGRGRLGAWLRAAIIKSAIRFRQEQQRSDKLGSAEDALVHLLVPDTPTDQRLDKLEAASIVRQGLYQALGELDESSRRLLRANLLDGTSIDVLAAQERVHRATIARRITKACGLLRQAMLRHLSRHESVGSKEAAALASWAESQLDLSLSRILPKT